MNEYEYEYKRPLRYHAWPSFADCWSCSYSSTRKLTRKHAGPFGVIVLSSICRTPATFSNTKYSSLASS
jgi:hypothetical protein